MMVGLLLRMLPYLAAIGIAAALVAGIYSWGRNDEAAAWKLRAAEAQKAAMARETELRNRVTALASDLEAARAKRRVVTKTITKEVPVYVQAPAPECAAAGLHAPGFRVLHDAAAAGELPDPARVAAAAAVEPAAAAAAIADNYATCHDLRDQLLGWQRWWGEVSR